MQTSSKNTLSELGIVVLRQFITPEQMTLCREYLQSVKDRYANRVGLSSEYIENDQHHPDTFSFYSPLCTEVLLLKVLPEVEVLAGIKLVPSYSYARTYYQGSFLEKHTDRRCSQFGISICLDKDGPEWPLVIIDKGGQSHSVELSCGDAVMFLGMQLEHYRDKYVGRSQTQIFLFYMPQDDSLSNLYFDRRPSLGSLPAK
jgi:hypothetical protein